MFEVNQTKANGSDVLNTTAFQRPIIGDNHQCLNCKMVDGALVLSTPVIKDCHIEPLYMLIKERAAQLGIDLTEVEHLGEKHENV